MNARIVINGDTKGRPYELSMVLDENGKLVSLAGVIRAVSNRGFYYEPERPMSLERYGESQKRLCAELIKFLHREAEDANSHTDRAQRASGNRKADRLQAKQQASPPGAD